MPLSSKAKGEKSGGFINGQSVVLVVLVTPKVTIPVGVDFYRPDPAMTAWNKEEKLLKKRGVPKKKRPGKPPKNPAYPNKPDIALRLLRAFRTTFPQLVIRCVVADKLK